MRRKWVLIAVAAGLLALAIGAGAVLASGGGGKGHAWGGPGHAWVWGREDHDDHQSAVASKVAEILGTDEQETEDAIAEARREVREEAEDNALNDFAGRVAESLGTDADATAEAIRKVAEEMLAEALEARLQAAIDDGRLTEEQGQEYRDRANWHMGWRHYGLKASVSEGFASRVAEELEVEGENVAAAMEQARSDIHGEVLESRLQAAIDSGQISEEEAEEIRQRIESGNWKGFGKKGHHGRHGGKGHWGRGQGHKGHHSPDGDSPPAPATNGDSA